jgi:recombination protein RecR
VTDAPREIERLIELMARLPGLGPRSARRAARSDTTMPARQGSVVCAMVPMSALDSFRPVRPR